MMKTTKFTGMVSSLLLAFFGLVSTSAMATPIEVGSTIDVSGSLVPEPTEFGDLYLGTINGATGSFAGFYQSLYSVVFEGATPSVFCALTCGADALFVSFENDLEMIFTFDEWTINLTETSANSWLLTASGVFELFDGEGYTSSNGTVIATAQCILCDGTDGSYSASFIAVPAPATLALFGLGLAGFGFARRRKA